MSLLRAKIVSAVLVVAIAVPAAARSAHERHERLLAEREMADLAQAIEPVALVAGTERRVTINGATMWFRKKTEQGSLDEVMARVAAECASGSTTTAFGLASSADDGAEMPIRLERVHSQESEDGAVRASLCIFAKGGPSDSEETRRVRYTLAHRRDDGSIAVTTVVNASGTPLQELFPAEGDAPGSDLPGVPRPERARRTVTAIVGKGEHAVRIYESEMAAGDAVASYDRQMSERGFATTGALEDARMYRKDGRSFVASFRATTDGSTVALMPFGNDPSD